MSQPSKTLYVNNLDDHVKKDELRHQLYQLFTTYGRVVDIVAVKNNKMRGQAHIVFNDQVAATTAMRALSGEPFYGKPLNIAYAKSMSNKTKELLDPDSLPALPKSKSIVTSTAQREADALKKQKDEEDTIQKRGRGDGEEDDEDEESRKSKKIKAGGEGEEMEEHDE